MRTGDLAEKSARQCRPTSGNQEAGWGTSKLENLRGAASKLGKCCYGRFSLESFKVKLVSLNVDNLDIVKTAFQEGVIDINSEFDVHCVLDSLQTMEHLFSL